jgi:hypothetical protein
MRNTKRIGLWLWAGVLVAALAMPSFVPAAASTGSQPDQGGIPRIHDWADGVPPEGWNAGMARTKAWLADWSATRAQRPPVDPVQQTQTTAQWTVMVFMAADNNLEIAALFDVNEMEVVGSSPDVNILVEIDRSADYVDVDGDWTETRRYFIQQDDNFDVISSPVVENLGEIDSGSADAVADFATWGISNYPAEKYMLVLWDHGGAWISHASDEDSGEEITLPELTAGLDRVKAETGIDQFEVMGFDMCLMGQLEVYQTITPYARYGIGSQENEPGAGWLYVFLDELIKNPQMDGAQLGQQVVDYFMYYFEEILITDDLYGLGVVDLSQGSGLIDAIGQFTAAVEANPGAALSPVADARNNTISYGGFDDPQYYDIWSSVDLYQFADQLNSISTSPELQQAAQGVMQAVDNLVVYERHVDQLDGSHGVSIYFPRTMKAYKIAALNERYPVEVPASMAAWIEFLDVFHGTASTTVTNAPTVDVLAVYPDVASIYQPAVVTMEVSGRDILQVNYAVSLITSESERVVLDFDYLVSRTTTPNGADIVNWSDGVTTRTFIWEAEVPVLSDGSASTYALLIPTRDDPNVAVVNGEYTSVRGGDPLQAQLLFDLNTRQSTALWGINQTASGALQPFELQVESGDQFRPIWLTLDANNDLSGSSFGDTLTLTDAQSISFEKVPAPTGSYSVSFVAENVTGEKTMDEAIIEVNNENLDPALRGYTDLTFGVNFLYPASWIRPRFTPDGTRLFTADLATNTILSLYPYTDVSSAEETDAAIRASWNDLENLQINNERSLEINGLPAFVTDYSYTFNEEPRVGAVIAIYEPNQNVGYAFDLDAPASDPAPAQEALTVLADSINFFQTAEVVGQSGWQTVTPGGVSFPVPADWTEETSGDWTLYGPVNNPAVFVGLATESASGLSNADLAQSWVDDLQTSVADFKILASEPFYIGNREWHVVVFTYQDEIKMAGAFFTTTDGQRDYTFWLEAPDADFDQLYADVFSVTIGGFAFAQ